MNAGELELLSRRLGITLPQETTPAIVTPEIMQLAVDLAPGQQPVFIPVKPEAMVQHGECYRGVARLVREKGGAMRSGWIIWEERGTMLEAERHACWETDGQLVDVTPKPDGETTILFVADDKPWNGQACANRVKPLGKTPEVLEYCRLAEKASEGRAKGVLDMGLMAKQIEALLRLYNAHPSIANNTRPHRRKQERKSLATRLKEYRKGGAA